MKKVEGSAIYYALFLSVIFALILGGLLLFSSFNKNLATRFEIQQQLIDNANSGIAYGQVYFREIPATENLSIRLFNKGIDSVELSLENWGAYFILKSTSKHRKTKHTKIALLGSENTEKKANLFIPDNGRPLSICGNTRLEGTVSLPKAGVKRAYISGKNYQGSQLVYGNTTISDRQLPATRPGYVDELIRPQGEILNWEDVKDSACNLFSATAQHYISDGFINLGNKVIKGHVILEAKETIVIPKTAIVENCIIKAKRIIVEEGFVGQFQGFASEHIEIQKNVVLNYPSVIGLVEQQRPIEESSTILVAENAQVIGSVFLVSKDLDFRKQPQLSILENGRIDGMVYCQGKTELKGTVNGHLFTNKFALKTQSSAYENHILDGQILDQLPEQFVYIPLLEETTQLNQIQWLR